MIDRKTGVPAGRLKGILQMIALSATNLTKVYSGVNEVFSNVSFSINKGDRVGIVGPNGAGKSTLLNILSGEDRGESGDVYVAKDMSIGYFHQNDLFSSEGTVYEEMLSVFSDVFEIRDRLGHLTERISELAEKGGEELDRALAEYDRLQNEFERRNGYSARSEIDGVLSSMNFPENVRDKDSGPFRRGEDKAGSGHAPAQEAGYTLPGRAYKPFGYRHSGVAGAVREGLSGHGHDNLPRQVFPGSHGKQDLRA